MKPKLLADNKTFFTITTVIHMRHSVIMKVESCQEARIGPYVDDDSIYLSSGSTTADASPGAPIRQVPTGDPPGNVIYRR